MKELPEGLFLRQCLSQAARIWPAPSRLGIAIHVNALAVPLPAACPWASCSRLSEPLFP